MKQAIFENEYINNKDKVYAIMKKKHFDLEHLGVAEFHDTTMNLYKFTIDNIPFSYYEGLGHELLTAENKANKIISALHCVLLDADTMNFYKSIDSFANDMGFTSISQAINTFYLCKETKAKLEQLFTKQELSTLTENIIL